jgi:7-cyano-7-deazaguanine reductase
MKCRMETQLFLETISSKANHHRGATQQTMDNPTHNRVPGKYGTEEIESSQLEAWPNSNPERDYIAHFEIPEFTCLCPRSGFPDFATIIIDYVPDQVVVELKSLKLYINKYRNRQISHESATNTILDDLATLLSPRWMRVVADFTVRGNIKTIIFAEHSSPEYRGPRPEYRRYLSS